MKLVICALALALFTNNAEANNTYTQIKVNNPNLNPHRAFRISNAINETSKKYNIRPKLLSAILMQESAYKLDARNCNAGLFWRSSVPDYGYILPFVSSNQDINKYFKQPKNRTCYDFGIGQINHVTIVRNNLESIRLISDVHYSVDAAGMIISRLKNRYEKIEPDTWWTRYNAISPNKRLTYKKLVTRYMK